MCKPTKEMYGTLQKAYDHFNAALFNSELPECLITIRSKGKALGYFASERFSNIEEGTTDEIALNPLAFERSIPETLSTLAHEMTHLWQFRLGKPSRNGYHNKEWGTKMEDIGLMPSNTGQAGGKRTGQQMTHYIVENDLFDEKCTDFLKDQSVSLWSDIWQKGPAKKTPKKTKYTCECSTVWGKPDLLMTCNDCNTQFIVL